MSEASGTGLSAYRELLADPRLRRLAVASVAARLAISMWSIVLFVLVATAADESSAALMVAMYTLGQAATAPIRGRWVDRLGVRPVLRATTLAHLVTLGVLVSSVAYGSSGWTLALAVAAGSSMPPVVATIRGLWIALTPVGPRRHAAMALDSVLLEVSFIAGPALGGLWATLGDPRYAVLLVVALLILSAVAVLRVAPSADRADSGESGEAGESGESGESRESGESGQGRRGAVLGPLARLDFVVVLLLALVPTTTIAGVELMLLTISSTGGYEWAGGPLLALMSVGSLLGGLAFGAYGSRRPPTFWLPIMLLVLAASVPLVLLGQAHPWAFVVLAPVLGATTAPSLASVFSLSATATPAGKQTEAQSWVNTSVTAGFAAGALVVASLTQRPGVAVLVLAVLAAVGALAARLSLRLE